jgi:phosphatidylglycerophosphate synthase
MRDFVFLSEKNRDRYLRMTEPFEALLVRMKIHPNVLSLTGVILSFIAGLFYCQGAFFWGSWVVVLAGTCDILDGQIARRSGKETRFGAFFDSTLDRFGEVFIFMGLAWYFAGGGLPFSPPGVEASGAASPWAVVFIVFSVGGSFMVSYTRSRAEGLGVHCRVGLMQRPERLILLIIGTLLGSLPIVGLALLKATLLLLALSTNFTALQRIVHVKNQLKEQVP